MDPFRHTPRKRFTELEYAQAFAKANGCCEKCGRKLMAGDEWDYDHRVALENGGSNEVENMWVLCSWCHDDKTPDDHRLSRKSKRMYAKHVVPKRLKKRGWR